MEYLCKAISGEFCAGADKYVKEVNGYTVVDARKAVEALSGLEYAQLFGATTERALIFTNVENPGVGHDDCTRQPPETSRRGFPSRTT